MANDLVKITPILCMHFNQRKVYLAWTERGELAISVYYDGGEPHLITIPPTIETSDMDKALARVPRLISGTMALLTLCEPPSREVFESCLDVANVMTCFDDPDERMHMLTQVAGEEMAKRVMNTGWRYALDLEERLLGEAERSKIHDACKLYFSLPSSVTRQ